MSDSENKLANIVSLAKRRGFIYPGSEIYGGQAGAFDWGPLGVALKNNVKDLWWKMFVTDHDDMYGLDAAILMKVEVWKASGHVGGFTDPLVTCAKCHHRFRADQVDGAACPDCGGKLGEARQFNMMFETKVGAVEDSSAMSYLRPETAQGMFVNFKNVVDSFHPKLPFGLGQIGKAFRNEITPRDFLFRSREFEQMEVEYFVAPDTWVAAFEVWRARMHDWAKAIGLKSEHVHELEVADGERAHYSLRTIDFEFDYPFGRKELYGLAYRADYDLSQHQVASGADLTYFDEATGERFLPHVIEPSLGVDRTVLAILCDTYTEDELNGEARTRLALAPQVAPYKAAIFPLLKNKPELVLAARQLYKELKQAGFAVAFDDNGNIGKRYRRQDEIGTPWCLTVDFDTMTTGTITWRDRDTGEQERLPLAEVGAELGRRLARTTIL